MSVTLSLFCKTSLHYNGVTNNDVTLLFQKSRKGYERKWDYIELLECKGKMDILKAEIERKRKQFEEITQPNRKYLKRSELLQKEEEKIQEDYQVKHRGVAQTSATITKNEDLVRTENQPKGTHNEPELDCDDLPRTDVIKRLRSRSQPIMLFGETEQESRARLRKLEIEQPDMKEGWKNDFQSAMKEVDHELIEEVIKGEQNNA
ncbi:unnamed protein product, partial [Onchocerca ochengi]|uniref:SFM domain-containing protein n=1 Tax=Onchocerca ochengi TaxID=42157 RepID=A0A182EFE4_ONCOC